MKKFILLSVSLIIIVGFSVAGINFAKQEEYEVENYNYLPEIKNDTEYEAIKAYSVQTATDFIVDEEEELERPIIPNIPLDDELLDYIWGRSLEEYISYELILAICNVESNFLTDAYSHTKDSGLAQINASNIEWLAEEAGIENVDPMNPYHSIDMMIELIKYEREYFLEIGMSEEDVYWAVLIAYNMGRGNALNYIRKNGFNYGYAKKVDKMKQYYEQEAIY